MKDIEITTNGFILRSLTASDATERYLNWFSDYRIMKYIIYAHNDNSLKSIEDYILEKSYKQDALLLGIFEKYSMVHIGNIKYEPNNFREGHALMGIMIGDNTWRNKGVANEVIKSSGFWLKNHYKINRIILGVDEDNIPAIAVYKKIGFIKEKVKSILVDSDDAVSMVWSIV